MKNFLFSLVFSTLLASSATAKTLLIVLDISTSVPLVYDDSFARNAGTFTKNKVAKLSLGDSVNIRLFGEYGAATNNKTLSFKISRKHRPSDVASAVYKIISAIPQAVRTGKITPQTSTNLLGYLEDESYRISCSKSPTEILILSDGVEASIYVSPQELVTGKKNLPYPKTKILSGCNLTMVGIGKMQKGSSPTVTTNVIAAWRNWSKKAGINKFTPLPRFN